jgi:hypothetical protein
MQPGSQSAAHHSAAKNESKEAEAQRKGKIKEGCKSEKKEIKKAEKNISKRKRKRIIE